MLKNISKIAAVFAIAAVIAPSLALAHGTDRDASAGTWTTNQYGVKVFNVNANGNTNVNTNANTNKEDTDVDADDTVNSNVNAGDKDHDSNFLSRFMNFVRHNRKNGDKDNGWHLGSQKNANSNLNVNGAAFAKGTVTAVNGDTLTLQTKKDGTTVTVNTNSNTSFADSNANTNNSDLTSSDVQVGMTAKVIGFWDSVKNVFNAIKVKFF